MGKRKNPTKTRLTKKEYQDIQMKRLANKIAEQQKVIKHKSDIETDQRRAQSLSKHELQRLKKEKREALRQYTLRKAQLQLRKNKQIRNEWQQIQQSIKEDMEKEQEESHLNYSEELAKHGWSVDNSFEADAGLVGSGLSEHQKKHKMLKEKYGNDFQPAHQQQDSDSSSSDSEDDASDSGSSNSGEDDSSSESSESSS